MPFPPACLPVAPQTQLFSCSRAIPCLSPCAVSNCLQLSKMTYSFISQPASMLEVSPAWFYHHTLHFHSTEHAQGPSLSSHRTADRKSVLHLSSLRAAWPSWWFCRWFFVILLAGSRGQHCPANGKPVSPPTRTAKTSQRSFFDPSLFY